MRRETLTFPRCDGPSKNVFLTVAVIPLQSTSSFEIEVKREIRFETRDLNLQLMPQDATGTSNSGFWKHR